MKKKLFFKLFIFAVIGAFVTVTSCKDYDDDISGLETEISSVKSELSTLDADISSAQTAADNALAKANEALAAAEAAGDAAAIAALEAEVASIQAQLTELSGLKDEVTALMAELTAANAEQLETIKAEVQALSDQLLAMVGGMVTDVELLYSVTSQDEDLLDLTIAAILEKDNVFEEGISNAITFNEGTKLQKPASIIIRVSPSNAEITPEMINLQTSKGDIYENLEIISVEPYDKLLTRSTNGAGLWEVKVQLKDYDEDEFKAATVDPDDDTKKILFAVAVDNTQTAENPMIRKVVSTYDLTLTWSDEFTGAAELDFSVDEKPVGEINNRFTFANNKSITGTVTGDAYDELTWSDDPDVEGDDDNTEIDNDNRSTKDAYPAVQGQPLTISLVDPNNSIRAMYVTLDYEQNAVESAPSEWNAWNNYSYTGLGTVVEGTETQITINSNQAINDFIGFRVFAVNYDGTLVDPDGKAFYVSLGKEATNWNAVNTVITATEQGSTVTSVKSATANATLTKLTGATTYEWTTDNTEAVPGGPAATKPAFHVYIVESNGTTAVFNTSAAAGAVGSTVDFSKGAKIYTMPTVNNWLAYKDNKVYNGKLTIKNATGHVLATLDVTFKKELPGVPNNFSIKSEQLENDGIYYSYLIPNTWTANNAVRGTMGLDQVFNFGDGTIGNYETIFEATDITGTEPADFVVNGNGDLIVDASLIDNETEHQTTVTYNYGLISTESKNSSGTVVPYVVTIEEFPTVYSNIYNHTYSWNWLTLAQYNEVYNISPAATALPFDTEIIYGAGDPTTTVPADHVNLGHIYGVSTRDSEYNALLSAPYKSSLLLVDAKLISNANGEEEYFDAAISGATITFTVQSGSTNPTADVPSTLVIEALDMYDNDVVIELPMTVKKR